MSQRSSGRPPVVSPVRLDNRGVGPDRGPGPRAGVEAFEQRAVRANVRRPAAARAADRRGLRPFAPGGWGHRLGGLRWAGGSWFSGVRPDGSLKPVVLAVGSAAIRSQDMFGIEVSQERLGPIELTTIEGVGVTSLVRSVCYVMRYAVTSVRRRYCSRWRVSRPGVHRGAAPSPGPCRLDGIPQARDGLPSPMRTLVADRSTRPRHRLAGRCRLPRLLTNVPIFDRGGGTSAPRICWTGGRPRRRVRRRVPPRGTPAAIDRDRE